MAAIKLVRPLALRTKAADRALKAWLAETRSGAISAIELPDGCLVRLVRRHDLPRSRECVVTWELTGAHSCTFIGSMSIVDRGPAQVPLLVLEGTDARLAADQAEATGNAVLDRIAAALIAHSMQGASLGAGTVADEAHRFMRNAAPMLHAASPKSAKMG